MKLTVEFSATELQKMLQAMAGSEEHKNTIKGLSPELVSRPKD